MIYDDGICHLGEGPLWHPGRGELFWFDILGRRLHRKGQSWRFDRFVSAAGWVDDDRLMIASDRALSLFSIGSGKVEDLCPLEADLPGTRSNDGRADPQGGFWIGTMGIAPTPGLGSIWRWYRGELRRLYGGIAVTNAICFSPDGTIAYFCDTFEQVIRRVQLDRDGWPSGEPEIHVDLRGTPWMPDGATVDAEGNLWNAQWGGGRVAGYDTAGREIGVIPFPAVQSTCPAFGGEGFGTLFCTSAAVGLDQPHVAAHPDSGRTFAVPAPVRGLAEYRVIL